MDEMLICFISGGALAALITAVVKALADRSAWKQKRKAKKEDKAEKQQEEKQKQAELRTGERLKAIEKKTDIQSEALKFIMYDRIRYLGQEYIAAKEIDFDDRRILNEMHHSYHNGLCGNGDLDTLMEEVNHLPLKIRE